MKKWLPTIAVFLFIFGLFSFIEWKAPFPDPDSFYHAKMALIIRDQGFIHEFPWFAETYLAKTYVDPHLLYHIFLIPFVTFFDPLVGMKLSAVIFGLVAMLALYQVLRKLGAKYPEFFVLAASLSINFFYRLAFPRAISLSVALFLIIILLILSQRKIWLLIVTSIFTWFYYGWPILLVAWLVISLGDYLSSRVLEKKFVWHEHFKTLVMIGLGVVIGLVLNPYFPENIYFVFDQAFKVGLLNKHVMTVGSEWSPIGFFEFLSLNIFPLVLMTLIFSFFIGGIGKLKSTISQFKMRTVFSLALLFGFFAIMTFKSQRYIEYAIPAMIIFGGSISDYSWQFCRQNIWPEVIKWWQKHQTAGVILMTILLFSFGAQINKEMRGIVSESDYFRAEQYQEAVDYLKNNLNPQDKVFTNVWDFTSVLFYLDDSRYYLVGLDPRFFYDTDPERFNDWNDLINGQNENLYFGVVQEFDCQAVVVDKRITTAFEDNIRKSQDFNLVLENEWVAVFMPL